MRPMNTEHRAPVSNWIAAAGGELFLFFVIVNEAGPVFQSCAGYLWFEFNIIALHRKEC
jgi:hypothetical protein